MYASIAIPMLVSLFACTSAMPTNYGVADLAARAPIVESSLELLSRAATAPPACAKKGKRAPISSGSIAKRIAQSDLPAVAQSWQDLCNKSGGDLTTGTPCVTLAGDRGISALLANGAPCDQQDVADDMVTFAKSKGIKNKQALIDNAIAYRKHPRNALALDGGVTPSTPFCQKAPKNAELKGVVNAQLDGVNPGLFGGPKFTPVAFGDPASCPFGQKPNVGSCTCA